MKLLPGNFDDFYTSWDWTHSMIIAYVSMDYLDVATYVLLFALALRNIVVILVKQKEYKNPAILAFYAYTLIAVSLRPIVIIGWWSPYPIGNLDFVQQGAKLCVGIVQDWITFELAVRIHNAKGYSDISEAEKRKLRKASIVLFTVVTLAFIAWAITIIVVAHKEGNEGWAFLSNYCVITYTIGFLFLL